MTRFAREFTRHAEGLRMSGEGAAVPPRRGPPPLRPFGLVLHHDGRWSHEGAPILNRKLREAFDRGVRFLPNEGDDRTDKFVVTLQHFRGQIIVEEAAFFVRSVELETGEIALSDRSRDGLEIATLTLSPIDGALLCRVKRNLKTGGVLARFTHAAQAELLDAAEERDGEIGIEVAETFCVLPDLGQ